MQPEGIESVLTNEDSVELLPLRDCQIRDLYQAGFQKIGDLSGETETSLAKKIPIRNQRGWGKTKIANLQRALESSGFERLPRIIPRT